MVQSKREREREDRTRRERTRCEMDGSSAAGKMFSAVCDVRFGSFTYTKRRDGAE